MRVANAPASRRRSALRRATRGAPSKARNAPRATRQSVCRLTAVREHTTHHADVEAENRVRPSVRRARPSRPSILHRSACSSTRLARSHARPSARPPSKHPDRVTHFPAIPITGHRRPRRVLSTAAGPVVVVKVEAPEAEATVVVVLEAVLRRVNRA